VTTEIAQTEIPSPPRPVTRAARSRSWNEPSVRRWLLLSLLVALTTAYFAWRDLRIALHERWLIAKGLQVNATVESVSGGGADTTRKFTRNEVRDVKLRYSVDGHEYTTNQELPIETGKVIGGGDIVALRVDPQDHENVTTQTQARPWLASLTVVTLLVPVLLLLVLMTFLARKRVLRIWQDGELVEGTVVDWHRSGLAPKSVVVRFTLNEGDDRRLFQLVWPHSAGELSAGDPIALVMPPDEPGKALAAKLYE
jgi:hypothetical protein